MTLHPVEDTTTRAVRAQLHMVRYDQDGSTTEKTVGEVVLTEEVELPAERSWQKTFSVTVPDNSPPSFDARYSSQHWFLEVVVDRKRAGGYMGTLEVVVNGG